MSQKNPSRPGPGGSVIYKRRPRGSVKGVPGPPRTEKQKLALRTAGYVHGKRATVVTREEAVDVRLARASGREDMPAITKAYVSGFAGDLTEVEQIAAVGLASQELVRRQLFERIQDDGAIVKESVTDSDGRVVADRLRVHPGIEQMRKLGEAAGFVASEQRLTPKSRGEGARDDAIAKMLARDAMLRAYPKDRMPAPPPDDSDAIDSEVVEGPST